MTVSNASSAKMPSTTNPKAVKIPTRATRKSALREKLGDTMPENLVRAKIVVVRARNGEPGFRAGPGIEERARARRRNDRVGLAHDREQRHVVALGVVERVEGMAQQQRHRQPRI